MTNKCTIDTYSFRRDFEKIAPYLSCNREKFVAKVPGNVTVAAPGNAYYRNHRAVSCKAKVPKFSLHRDFRRSRKSFEALPCNPPVASKHMLLCPPGLRHRANSSYDSEPFSLVRIFSATLQVKKILYSTSIVSSVIFTLSK